MPDQPGKPKDPTRRPEGWDEKLDWGDELADEHDPASDAELWADDGGDETLTWEDELLEEPASPDDLEWEETEVGDWDEKLDWGDELTGTAETALEIEELETEPAVVGWSAEAVLPGFDAARVPVRCSTDSATTSFFVAFHVAGQTVVIDLAGVERTLPLLEADGELVVSLGLILAGVELDITARLRATSGSPRLELGRDTLAGRFLVDPAREGAPGQH